MSPHATLRAQSFAFCRDTISLCRRHSFLNGAWQMLWSPEQIKSFLPGSLLKHSAKALLALVPPRDVPFLEMLILILVTLLQITWFINLHFCLGKSNGRFLNFIFYYFYFLLFSVLLGESLSLPSQESRQVRIAFVIPINEFYQHPSCKGVLKGKHMTYTAKFHLDRVKRRLCHSQNLRLKNIFNDLENCQAKLN